MERLARHKPKAQELRWRDSESWLRFHPKDRNNKPDHAIVKITLEIAPGGRGALGPDAGRCAQLAKDLE